VLIPLKYVSHRVSYPPLNHCTYIPPRKRHSECFTWATRVHTIYTKKPEINEYFYETKYTYQIKYNFTCNFQVRRQSHTSTYIYSLSVLIQRCSYLQHWSTRYISYPYIYWYLACPDAVLYEALICVCPYITYVQQIYHSANARCA
jgi:hypothetical protein